MHTTMVPEQVKTMKIQAGIQVSRPGELKRQLQLWKRFGRLYSIVFVLVRNIVQGIENKAKTDCSSVAGCVFHLSPERSWVRGWSLAGFVICPHMPRQLPRGDTWLTHGFHVPDMWTPRGPHLTRQWRLSNDSLPRGGD
ncbi:hypothetical protein Tco_0099225 [Tanacetum coccineum]